MPSDQLPSRPVPQGRYVPAIAAGGLVLAAGMTPRVDGVLRHVGRVGEDITVEEARVAAGIATSNALSAVVFEAGSMRAIGRALRLTVYINATPDFTSHPAVADGASDRLVEILGPAGVVVRSAVGVSSLPGGACVEVELTCLLRASDAGEGPVQDGGFSST